MDLGGTRNVGKNFHFERYKGAPEMRRKKLLMLNKFSKSISSEVAKLTKKSISNQFSKIVATAK